MEVHDCEDNNTAELGSSVEDVLLFVKQLQSSLTSTVEIDSCRTIGCLVVPDHYESGSSHIIFHDSATSLCDMILVPRIQL